MSDRSRDDQTKRFNEEYSDDNFLKAVRECSIASTPKIAKEIGCNRKTALRRLTALEDDGELESEMVSDAKVWTISE
ncbi:putative transcriptional regulator [Natrinema gari JCM 14663]|uniref:Putative transcriptional regulator n=1 Tax=Natrinema gari JCM 14663 TaxID=1230459 RepID=L9ZJD1_9EURY|nr:putative transcriptional regulator [Natrinema gari JCM 14663]